MIVTNKIWKTGKNQKLLVKFIDINITSYYYKILHFNGYF